MKRSRRSDEQIMGILKDAEVGITVATPFAINYSWFNKYYFMREPNAVRTRSIKPGRVRQPSIQGYLH